MSAMDKAKNAAKDAAGKVKETVGGATNNEDLEAEGKSEQVEADVRKGAENVKDTASDVKNSVQNKIG